MTAEERARTLTGRHQISGDGRHLVDGVPFGRPYLRHPSRPAVRIPPRKRRRLDEEELGEETEVVGLLTAGGETPLTNGYTSAGSEGRPRAISSKSVQFEQPELDDEDSDEDDDDFAPAGSDDEDVAMGDTDNSDSDDDLDSSSASDGSSSEVDSDDTSSDSDSDASSPPDVKSSKHEPTKKAPALPHSPNHVTPGLGRSATHKRNARRTQTNRLRHFKEAGKLGPDADLRDLARYEAAKGLTEPTEPLSHGQPYSTYAGTKRQIEDDETMDDGDATEEVPELEHRKHELMARFGEVPLSTVDHAQEGSHALQEPTATGKVVSPKRTVDELQPAKQETPRKRLRPDTAAIGRMLVHQAMVGTLFLS